MKQPLPLSFEIDPSAEPVDFDAALAKFLLNYVRRSLESERTEEKEIE